MSLIYGRSEQIYVCFVIWTRRFVSMCLTIRTLNIKEVRAVYKSMTFIKSRCCSKVEILFESQYFVHKSRFCLRVNILFESRDFARKSRFCLKVDILIESHDFTWFWTKSWHSNKNQVNRFCMSKYSFNRYSIN